MNIENTVIAIINNIADYLDEDIDNELLLETLDTCEEDFEYGLLSLIYVIAGFNIDELNVSQYSFIRPEAFNALYAKVEKESVDRKLV